MKKVTVSTTFWAEDETDTGYLITTLKELGDYIESQSGLLVDDFIYACKKNIPKSRWDHFYTSALGIGTTFAKMNDKSPIFEACNLLDTKHAGMTRMLLRFGGLFVNMNGGYHNFSHETHTIIKEEDVSVGRLKELVIAKNPSLMNLENDPFLERYTRQYFKDNSLELSYICHLRNFSNDELVEAFEEFKYDGGTGLFVYTTGMDINQMEDYCNAAIDAGLTSITIHFNVEISEEHKTLLDGLSESHGHVTIDYKKV